MNDTTEKLLTFFKLMQEVKNLIRFEGQVFWEDYPPRRYESVADHTWRMGMMLITIEPHLQKPINLSHALKMLLVHDIPEIIAGDASPLGSDGTGNDSHAYNKDVQESRHKSEEEAAREIFGKLPKEQGDELLNLWLEFEAQESFEAKVVKAIDKIEAILQVLEYTNGYVHAQHREFNMTYGVKPAAIDPALKSLMQAILNELDEKYIEFVPEKN